MLITLNSYSGANHHGINILKSKGFCIKFLRYSDEQVRNKIIRKKWLNTYNVLMIYHLHFCYPYDDYQVRHSAVQLEYCPSNWTIARKKRLFVMCMYPMRNYIAYAWLDMLKRSRYAIAEYDLIFLSKISEYTVDAYIYCVLRK